jgi:hypothetical protein
LDNVTVSGPSTGSVESTYTFTATVAPIEATLPITYVWQATEQPSVTHSSELTITDSIEFAWTTPGTDVVTSTVSNAGGQATSRHAITICGTADVVCNCFIDIGDIQAVAGHWRCEPGGCYEAQYDINSDGRIDIVDIMLVAARWGCGCGDECYMAGPLAAATLLPMWAFADAQPALVSIEPVTSTVTSGDTFTVSVVISEVVNLGAFQFEMHYHPTVVHAEGAALGPFPGSTGRNVGPVGPTIDNDAGALSFGAFSFGKQPGPDGGGVLAELTLTAQGAGSSALDLRAVQVLYPSGEPQSVTVMDGTAMVEGRLYLPLILRTDR